MSISSYIKCWVNNKTNKMKIIGYKIPILTLIILFFVSCSPQNVNLRSFTDPSILSSSVINVAIFPIRNTRILPGESREMARAFTREFVKKNPNIHILSATESTNKINENEMAEQYTDFLRDYAVSGIPNVKTLNKIGKFLEVDAIVQGEIFDVFQRDGHYPGVFARTSLTLRYSMLSTSKGDVLWEATCSASLQRTYLKGNVWAPPYPIIDVIQLAQEKVLTDIPYLGR